MCKLVCCCCEAAEWSASAEGCFLKLAEGSSYVDVFKRLRLNYVVTEYNSALVVENDHILPHGVCVFSWFNGMNLYIHLTGRSDRKL